MLEMLLELVKMPCQRAAQGNILLVVKDAHHPHCAQHH
jgi:hypothetical protein